MRAVRRLGDHARAVEGRRGGDPVRCLRQGLQGEAPAHAIAHRRGRPRRRDAQRIEHGRQVGAELVMPVAAGEGEDALPLRIAVLAEGRPVEADLAQPAPIQVRQQRPVSRSGDARGHAVQCRAHPWRIHQHQHGRRGLRRLGRRVEMGVQHALGGRDVEGGRGDGHAPSVLVSGLQRRATVSTTTARTTTRVPFARAVRSAAASAAT